MKYLLDANAVIDVLRKRTAVLARVKRHAPADLAVSAIVMHELYFGAARSQRQASNMLLTDSLNFVVLDFDREDAREAGQIRATLAAAGTPIGPLDALIAGQARIRSLTLVTDNTSEFARVPDLRLENWRK